MLISKHPKFMKAPNLKARNLRVIKAVAFASALVIVLAACDLATLSGGGSGDSPISRKGRISLAIETEELCLKGTERDCENYSYQGGVQSVTGEFKDSGTNPSWPYGVSMKFEGAYTATEKRDIGVLLIAGDVCNEILGVPEGAPVGAEAKGSKESKNANCWLGGIGYRSADARHYPNSTPCFGDSAVLSDALRSGLSRASESSVVSETVKRLERDINSDRDRGPKENQITGQALVLIVDANHNGRINEDAEPGKSPDAFILVSVCGPYSGIGSGGGLGSGYNYSTCPGGTLSSDAFIGSAISRRCLVPLRGGDLKIKIIPTTSTSTTTTLPPN
ncbi:hypothetical protein IMCC26256_111080 [Actinobacteria bacterium IMCC26256]|nr:hypothetical protein IMCC26256_111080 [Actinobacteria bacterium IMCC26256]